MGWNTDVNAEDVLTKLGKEEISLIDVPTLVKNKNKKINYNHIKEV